MRARIISWQIIRRVIASAGILLLIALMVIYWRRTHPPDYSWLAVEQSGILRVGVDPTTPPFSTFSGDTLAGIDPDLAHEIARRLGVKVQFVPLGIDGLYQALITGQVDCLISALSIDPTKYPFVIYSMPYIESGMVLVSRAGNESMADLDGKRLAVEYGSIGDEVARRWTRRLHALDVQRPIQAEDALIAVIEGRADAALIDHISARIYLRKHPDSGLKIAPEAIYSDPYVIATRIQATALSVRMHAALDAMLRDGTVNRILDQWFDD